MKTQFVTNEKGKKIAAVIPIREYEDFLKDIHSAAIIERRRNAKTHPWDELKRNLVEDGILPPVACLAVRSDDLRRSC